MIIKAKEVIDKAVGDPIWKIQILVDQGIYLLTVTNSSSREKTEILEEICNNAG